MARKSKDWTDMKLKARLQQGRGQGDEDYQPWLKVSDLPSRGRVTRLYSRKMDRTIHLLSDMQTMYYYSLEFDERVLFVKEQYPLLDVANNVLNMDEMLLKRLQSSDGTPHVIVTTFLITATDENGKEYNYARSLKVKSELEKKATLERLEIQRRYYTNLGIDWAIVTEDEINYTRGRNIEWVLPAFDIQDYGMSDAEVEDYGLALIDFLFNSSMDPLNDIFISFERMNRLDAGTGLLLFRYLIASKQIRINMDSKIDLNNAPTKIGLTVR
ncbi:TnsA endonuclease C-terminal domain-containing protein [Paenibacillus sp. FSL P4-0502]|uniref:TnsA endonuclease C-terminal domain-containing protein n=1 Tax=Paenibacillus sp. FSL P4-0502 TaxID=2975319 RepID=UPI0030FA26E3